MRTQEISAEVSAALPPTTGVIVYPLNLSSARRGARPDHALILGHARDTPCYELLHALSAISLGRVDVALRVRSDAVHGIELTGLASAVAEGRQFGQRLAIQH